MATKKLNTRARKPLYLAIGIPAICIIILVWLGWLFSGAVPFNEEANMAQYLKQKYGKEFTISPIIERVGNSIGDTGSLTTLAWPLDDPALSFVVIHHSSGQYSDSFLTVLWSSQERESLEGYIKSIYPADELPRASVLISPVRALNEQKRGYVLNFEDAKKASLNRDIYYSVSLIDTTSFNPEATPEQQAKYIYEIAKHYASNGALNVTVGYTGTTDVRPDGYRYDYSCSLTQEKIDKLQSAQDVTKCFSESKRKKS